MFCLKMMVASDSEDRPASAAVSLSVSNLLGPTRMSTRVVLRVSSSSQSWRSLIRCLSSRPVISGMTSRIIPSPSSCRNETSMAMALLFWGATSSFLLLVVRCLVTCSFLLPAAMPVRSVVGRTRSTCLAAKLTAVGHVSQGESQNSGRRHPARNHQG